MKTIVEIHDWDEEKSSFERSLVHTIVNAIEVNISYPGNSKTRFIQILKGGNDDKEK